MVTGDAAAIYQNHYFTIWFVHVNKRFRKNLTYYHCTYLSLTLQKYPIQNIPDKKNNR